MLNYYFILPTIHPLIFITLALIVGVGCMHFDYGLLFITCIAFFIVAFLCIMKFSEKQQLLLLILVGLIAGIFRYQQEYALFNEFQQHVSEKTCSLKGKIIAIEKIENSHFKKRISLSLKEPRSSFFHPYVTHIYSNTIPNLQVADWIEINDIKIKKSNNHDFQHYLMKEKCVATIFQPTLACNIIYRPTYSFTRWIDQQKERINQSLIKKVSPSIFILFSSLFLGKQQKKHPMTHKVKENCLQWGISHYLARSGLHLVICIILWQLLFGFIPLPFWIKNGFLMGIVLIYTLLSWTSISFYRALWIFVFAKLGLLLRLPTQGLHTLTLICFFIILYNPMQLFSLDFQLSFLLTFALILHNNKHSRA